MNYKFKVILPILCFSLITFLLERHFLYSHQKYSSKQPGAAGAGHLMHVVVIYENSEKVASPLLALPSCPSPPHHVTLHVFMNSTNTIDCIVKRFGSCERVSLKFYESNELSVDAKSTHYSAASANKKLKLIEFFQHKLAHFLFLDADTFLVHGFDGLIYAWEYLYRFKEEQFIGMVRELSSFYSYKTYNSGMFLVDVHKSLQYPWKETLEMSIREAGETLLADQDVLNTLDRITNRAWFHEMECGLHLQYAGHHNCITSCVRVLHFNAMGSPKHTPSLDLMLLSTNETLSNPNCGNPIFPHEHLFDWIENPNYSLTCN